MKTDMNRKTFLLNLRQSGLMSARRVAALAKKLPRSYRGRHIARELVRDGLLTRFQAAHLLAGRTGGLVVGQYKILDKIGQGGMGRVFKAVHHAMDRTVALKVLAPQFTQTDSAKELFRREVKAAARLSHPNIVTAYDANRIAGRLFLVMEYVDGPNLQQLVRQHGPLPVDLACELVRQVACGLQYAADQGMVHRDIKPANLLVQLGADGGFTVKILDFGLARLQPAATDSSDTPTDSERAIMGTPDFLSPEQARDGQHADIRSDLYSLGCTLYYLLVGKAPFAGGNVMEKLLAHQNEIPARVDEERPDVPREVAAIVAKLLAKKPARRFQTPIDLAAALEPFAGCPEDFFTRPVAGGTLPDAPLFPGSTAVDLPRGKRHRPDSTFAQDLSPTPLGDASEEPASRWSWAGQAMRSLLGIFKR